MADVDANIRVQSIGADEASAALNTASESLGKIGRGSDALEEKFGHKFQHIGLQLFAGEALRASGVGMETRGVINVLNLALTSIGGAAGGAVAPFLMLVSALAAVGGIVAKVVEHHKNLSQELEKSNKATHDQLTKTNEALSVIQAYEKEVGYVPPELKKWEQAEKDLQKAQVERQIAGDKAQISSLSALIAQEQRHQEGIKDQIQDQQKLIESLKSMGVDQSVLIAQAAQLSKLNEAYKSGAMSVTEHKAKVDELILSVKMLGTQGTDDLKKLTEAHKSAREEADKELKAIQERNQKEADEDTARYQHWAELRAQQLKKHEEMYKQFEEHAKHAFNTINQEQSMAFSKMVVEGQSFSAATAHLWRDLAEQVIAQIEAMIVKLAILYAMTGGTGATGGVVGKILGFAEGGTVMVDKPTLFLAGEGGQPEVATFTPLSKLGQSGDSLGAKAVGNSMQIGSVETHIHGVTDPERIADTVGRKIVERIRGMGELNFTRSA
jgi:hypothetical protein